MLWFYTKKNDSEEEDIWHELVLNGIGGCTIAEAKQNITAGEFNSWIKYINKYGTINPTIRLEASSGQICYTIAKTNGARGVKPMDFMPTLVNINKQTLSSEPTYEDMMRLL